jgi:secretion/DNA translocation related TadE-like protein
MRARGTVEHGSAAVLGVGLLGVLMTVASFVAVLAGAVADQRRVESAADLGALAGASAVQHGRAACPAARSVVRRNRASVASCVVSGEVVVVTARRRTPLLLGRRLVAESTARAGPSGETARTVAEGISRQSPPPDYGAWLNGRGTCQEGWHRLPPAAAADSR